MLEATDRESKDAAVKVVDALIQKKKEEEEEKKKGIKAPRYSLLFSFLLLVVTIVLCL